MVTEPSTYPEPAPEPQASGGILEAKVVRKALAGFFLTGLLLAFLGPILPAWGYHLGTDFSTAGLHFLAMALGTLAGSSLARKLAPEKGVTFTLTLACALACVSLMYLALVGPPVSCWWRFGGIFVLGGSAGLLVSALFYPVTPMYRHDPAATVNLAGVFTVLGSLVIALLVAGTFYIYNVGSILFLIALIPGFFAVWYARAPLPDISDLRIPPSRAVWRDFRDPVAILFALLLFVQFGNEWTVAGWLAVFLIQRIGLSPASSLMLLVLYWCALLFGRVLAQALLPRVRHSRLLMSSAGAALFGCFVLSLTKGVFGAVSGVLFVGLGFAMVYPLMLEKIGDRFPSFHPAIYNGIFSFAMVGGLLAPWTLGYFADWFGIWVLMLLPLAGSFVVFLLLFLIWLEAKLSGRAESA